MNFKITNKRQKHISSKKKIIDRLFSNESKIYIFGLTKYSKITYRFLRQNGREIEGFIDDFSNEHTYMDKSIFKIDNINKDSIIISGVIEGRPKTVFQILKSKGFLNILDYFDLNYLFPKEFPIPYNNNIVIINNLKKLSRLYDKLADINSKKLLIDIIDFKLNFNYWEKDFEYNSVNQYFEPFINPENIEYFIDTGAFDGDTSKIAIKKFESLKKIYLIEPNKNAFEAAKKHLSSTKSPKIIFMNVAISNINGIGFITTEFGSANKLNPLGKQKVNIRKLDDIINSRVDYIKLDVEGEELNALLGAKNILLKYRPRIAVSVYHNPTHLWEIPAFVEKLNLSYKIYLRHYTEGIYETVMYFV